MFVTFTSRAMNSEEVFVIFETRGYCVPVVLVGHTRESIVAFDRSHINFEDVLVGRLVEDTVCLVNTEDVPINFKMDMTTIFCNESTDKLNITPTSGCLQPKER